MPVRSLQLPFTLPANLSVTQLHGESPSHRTGNAMDLAPLISGVSEADKIRFYVNTFARLFFYQKRGMLRINNSASCWHYHYDLRDGSTWGFGTEQYCYQTRTFMINGRPVKKTDCFECGKVSEYSARGPQAGTVFLSVLEQVKRKLSGAAPLTGQEILFSKLWDIFKESTLPEQNPTFVFFDDSKIREADVLRLFENFNSAPVWLPNAPTQIVSPGQSQDAHDLLLVAGVVLGGLYGIKLLKDISK